MSDLTPSSPTLKSVSPSLLMTPKNGVETKTSKTITCTESPAPSNDYLSPGSQLLSWLSQHNILRTDKRSVSEIKLKQSTAVNAIPSELLNSVSPNSITKMSDPHLEEILHRVTKMYMHWNPERLVDEPDFPHKTLQKWKGRETLLLKALIHKYGAEPPSPRNIDNSMRQIKCVKNKVKNSSNPRVAFKEDAVADTIKKGTPQNVVRHASMRSANRRLDKKGYSPKTSCKKCNDTVEFDPRKELDVPDDSQDKNIDLWIEGNDKTDQRSLLKTTDDTSLTAKWMGPNDMQLRTAFLGKLSKKQLPMPQTEGQFHASRMYIDELGYSIYDIDTWLDYIQIKGYTINS